MSRRCITHHLACECREAKLKELLKEVLQDHSDDSSPFYNECDEEPCQWCVEAQELLDANREGRS